MKIKKRRFFITLSIALIIISMILFTPYKNCLVFQFQNSGQALAYIPISTGEKFHIKYTHSIHLSHVVESFELTRDGKLKLYQLEFEDFAVGMPSHATGGEVFQQQSGKYYLKNMNRSLSSFDLRVGKVRANHTIIYGTREYPLSHFIEPGTWIRIKVEKINRWQQWKGVNMIE